MLTATSFVGRKEIT